jgi:hypothetical protein
MNTFQSGSSLTFQGRFGNDVKDEHGTSYKQNHRGYGLSPSSGILNNWEIQRFGNCITFRLQMKGGRHLLSWVPQKELISLITE